VREQFLRGAEVVVTAVSDPRVTDAWDRPSVLADQTIGCVASHLARAGVGGVRDYLDVEPRRPAVDFTSAAHYYSDVSDLLTEDDHAAIRERNAALSDEGPAAIITQLTASVDFLSERLPREPADRLVSVFQGNVMRLDDYLVTRIVEQVVHLDDLARSLGIPPWPNPPNAEALVIACGVEVARRRRGDTVMVRTLFRDAPAGVLPVL